MYVRSRILLVVTLLSTPIALSAQNTATPTPASAPAAPASGPRVNAAATAIRNAPAPREPAMQQRKSMGQPVALMIVGGAAIILGALIGSEIGTIFMIGGAIALLIGLYKYLQ